MKIQAVKEVLHRREVLMEWGLTYRQATDFKGGMPIDVSAKIVKIIGGYIPLKIIENDGDILTEPAITQPETEDKEL